MPLFPLQFRFRIRYCMRLQKCRITSQAFLGPIFIHSKSGTETYTDIFGHLLAAVTGCDFHALTLGSDDELAISKCLVHLFSHANVVLSSRHLQ